jgi:hypothetical protein
MIKGWNWEYDLRLLNPLLDGLCMCFNPWVTSTYIKIILVVHYWVEKMTLWEPSFRYGHVITLFYKFHYDKRACEHLTHSIFIYIVASE